MAPSLLLSNPSSGVLLSFFLQKIVDSIFRLFSFGWIHSPSPIHDAGKEERSAL